MKSLAKRLAGVVFGDYAIYRMLSAGDQDDVRGATEANPGDRIAEIDRGQLLAQEDEIILEQSGYFGPDSIAYAYWVQERVVACCIYWYGERYRNERNFWPLADSEAKLVQVITVPPARGKGIAGRLIRFSTQAMRQRGFKHLFARVWHSHHASLAAFERAGWHGISTVVEVCPLRLGKIRLVFGQKPHGV